jgi:hypothetical protein
MEEKIEVGGNSPRKCSRKNGRFPSGTKKVVQRIRLTSEFSEFLA